MCQTYWINGKHCESQKEVGDAIGSDKMKLVLAAHPEHEYQEDNCCCGLDATIIGTIVNQRIIDTGMWYIVGNEACEKEAAEIEEKNKDGKNLHWFREIYTP